MRFDLTVNSEFNVRHLTIELSLRIKGSCYSFYIMPVEGAGAL